MIGMDINLLIAKMKAQSHKDIQNISTAHTIVELCAILDGVANCDAMSCINASKIIDLIFKSNIVVYNQHYIYL